MKNYITKILLVACIVTTTSSYAEFSLQHGFDTTCESGATLLFGGLGLYFATKGLTIAQERGVSFKDLINGQFAGNFITRRLYNYLDPDSPKEARYNVLLSLASFSLLTGLCIKNSIIST